MKRRYPVVLEAYLIWQIGTEKEPTHSELITGEEHYDSFIRFHTNDKNGQYEIKSRRPKWSELKGSNWFLKVYYSMPRWMVNIAFWLSGLITTDTVLKLLRLARKLFHI